MRYHLWYLIDDKSMHVVVVDVVFFGVVVLPSVVVALIAIVPALGSVRGGLEKERRREEG